MSKAIYRLDRTADRAGGILYVRAPDDTWAFEAFYQSFDYAEHMIRQRCGHGTPLYNGPHYYDEHGREITHNVEDPPV